ncbi:TetR/AcrR family transcriptional regulator [Amycolatopsis rubida]|uniref:TetR/AcrR family transcriptional regulator n=1 Tax=Amycolatopsis rubida TaxID=112413 RepID=A0ABX0BQ59_9PSEU|nr:MULTISPECIES: TetR/AcrR family transcriptional regulator [Amycolatopsis]MYW92740.1 TetR family transcriptional regulator [Amycolatopsis rubida]NEC57726.1 TetR/AcrR family transcriptional regulator [Amycolatopsis rubida]OAP24884.1 HTH-type transcriptional regulator BetI [Amycolatopsis sp. M39]
MTDPDDLTARARIRDAAMRHFGEHGFERATIRGIAVEAGVSLGLVRHHFGSKQALREACDAHLIKLLRQLNDQVPDDLAASVTANPVAAARVAVGPYRDYLVRALVEGGVAPLFDEMVELGTSRLVATDRQRTDPPTVDPKVRAAIGTAMALSITVLHQHVSRAAGIDILSPAGDNMLARALIDIYSHPQLSLDEAQVALDRLPAEGN